MKTTSHTRGLQRLLSTRGFVFGALFFVLLLGVILWREPLSGFLWRGLSPVLSLRDTLQSGEVARLRAQLAAAEALAADRGYLYQENLDLKVRLQRNAEQGVLLAGVVARPPQTPYDTLIIDTGEREGVLVGNFVSAGGTLLVGAVSQVYPTTARVILFSAPGEMHNALLYLRDNKTVPLTLEGQGGGGFLSRVPVGTHASVGDAVLLPGISGGFFATVSAIELTEGESFETLYFHLPVSPFSLRYVEVWSQATL